MLFFVQRVPGGAGDGSGRQRGGIHRHAVRDQQPVGGGQVGVGAAGVLRCGCLGGQIEHAVVQQAAGKQRLVLDDIKVAVDVGFDKAAVLLAHAAGQEQDAAVEGFQRVVQRRGLLDSLGGKFIRPAIDAPFARVAQHAERQRRRCQRAAGFAPHQHHAQYRDAKGDGSAPDGQPSGQAQHGQPVKALGDEIEPLQQGVVARTRAGGTAEQHKADAPHGGEGGQQTAAHGGERLVKGVQRDGQQRDEQRLQIPHMLARRGGMQVLPHRDRPRDDGDADAQRQQQKQRQLGAAGVAAPAGAVQPAERQQHWEYPERQHREQHITGEGERQETPLLRRQPAGLIVGVAQPPEQRGLRQQEAGEEAAQQRSGGGKLCPPTAFVVPPDPQANQNPRDQVVEGDLFVEVEQVAECPGSGAPADAGARRGLHGAQEKVDLP